MPPLSKKLENALNEQIKNEISSAYLYLAMSAYCASANLKGAAHWLQVQWEEEIGHATKLLDHVLERGNKAALKAIEQPEGEYASLEEVFEHVLEHERGVTASIYKLCDLALQEKDYATQAFLQWFVTEQVEEERAAQEIVDTLKLAGAGASKTGGPVLLMIDRQLAARTKE
ncbi:MAG: ferritin [Planctomycetes bacterium]|nr:ferritin [Planctomycetota bacterium]